MEKFKLNSFNDGLENEIYQINGNFENINFPNIYDLASQFATLNNIDLNGTKITRVGMNFGKPFKQKYKTSGIIEIEHGIETKNGTIDPNLLSSKDYFHKGYIYKNLSKTKEALKSFKNASLLDINNNSSIFEIANIYFEEKNYEQALAYYEKALNLNKDFLIWGNYSVGNTYRAMKKFKEALAAYERAGDLLNRYNYFNNVHNFYKKVIAHNSNSINLAKFKFPVYDGFISLAIGKLYEETGNIEESRKFYTYVAWNKGYSWDADEAWRRLRIIGPDILKIIPVP